MIFLFDIQSADFFVGQRKPRVVKPRRKRNWGGVGGNALVGAATGGAIGDYATGAIRPKAPRLKRAALATGLVGGALAAGISKYRSNNRQR